jgi:hypothetical protein
MSSPDPKEVEILNKFIYNFIILVYSIKKVKVFYHVPNDGPKTTDKGLNCPMSSPDPTN